MKRLFVLAALVFSFVGVGNVYAEMQASGYSTSENSASLLQYQVIVKYFNNSGSAMTSGTVVIHDTAGSGLNGAIASGDQAGNYSIDSDGSDGDVDNLGVYITTTTTADDERAAGVVIDASCADQSFCNVVVRGPVRATCDDATDAITAGATGAVGTTDAAGRCGAGKGLGHALENGSGDDGAPLMIWVDPGFGT